MKNFYFIFMISMGIFFFADQNKEEVEFDITEQMYSQTTQLMETIANHKFSKTIVEGMEFSKMALRIKGKYHPRFIPIDTSISSLSNQFDNSYSKKVATKLLLDYGFPENEMEKLSLLVANSDDVYNAILYFLHTDAGVTPDLLRFQEKFSDEEIIQIIKKRTQNEEDSRIIKTISIFESLSKTAQKSLYLYLLEEQTKNTTQLYHQKSEISRDDIEHFKKIHSQTRDLSIRPGGVSIDKYFEDLDLKKKQIILHFEELLGKEITIKKIKENSVNLLDLNHLRLEIPLDNEVQQEIEQ